jgi:uncharacterized protein (TIGR03066 family)
VTRKNLHVPAVLFSAVVFVALGTFQVRADEKDDTKQLLVGVWTLQGQKGVRLEFANDGTITYDTGVKGITLVKGTYEVVGKNMIQVEYTEGGDRFKGKKKTVTIDLTKDSLAFDVALTIDKPSPRATRYVRATE